MNGGMSLCICSLMKIAPTPFSLYGELLSTNFPLCGMHIMHIHVYTYVAQFGIVSFKQGVRV